MWFGDGGCGAEVQPWPWEVGEGSTTTLQAQRQGLAQAMTEGRTPSSLPRPVLFTSVPFLANLSHSKSCFEKMKKCYLNVDCGGTLASTSAIALTASADLSDVAGVRCLHLFTTWLFLMKKTRQLSRQQRAALWPRFYQCRKLGNDSNSFLSSLYHLLSPFGIYPDNPLPEVPREYPKNLPVQSLVES